MVTAAGPATQFRAQPAVSATSSVSRRATRLDGATEIVSGRERKSLHRCSELASDPQGWHVQIVEKPLHGLQDEPLPSIIAARKALQDGQALLANAETINPCEA